ncbi:MAG: HemK2/MTQ2 family protein methyltransferase, partial [Candidatus Hydrothermarchaeaceae archaeon]
MRLYGLKMEICQGVYEPAEDTFLLADGLEGREYQDVLDMGTGTGLLALLCAARARRVVAVDMSGEAVMCAELNARRNGMKNIEVLRGDLFGALGEGALFDLILFNPPYLPEDGDDEAASPAWSGGEDGRDVIDGFLAQVEGCLRDGGSLLTVGSSLSDYEKTLGMLRVMGFEARVITKRSFFFEELA